MSDTPDDAAFAPQTGMPRSRLGRRFVAATATVLTAMLIVHGARVIHEDTFVIPSTPTPDARCDDGITRLRAGFEAHWQQRREARALAPVPDALERDLRALRPVCEREGDAALDRYEQLTRWRYRAEGITRLWIESLPDPAQGTSP